MPAFSFDDYQSLVGKFVVTQYGQLLVERVDLLAMTANGRFANGDRYALTLETILTSEVTEVDWHDPEVIEKYLAGEPIVDDVRLDTPPAASAGPCPCECGQGGGCYRLHQEDRLLPGHHTVPAVGCNCSSLGCRCMALLP